MNHNDHQMEERSLLLRAVIVTGFKTTSKSRIHQEITE